MKAAGLFCRQLRFCHQVHKFPIVDMHTQLRPGRKGRDLQPTFLDGLLTTGQNPASSGPAAKVLIEVLNKKAK